MNTRMGEELGEVWRSLAADVALAAVILTGEGRSFCAGADLKERDGMSDEAWAAQHQVYRAMIEAQLSIPVPVIAAVNGAAMGGGGEMVLACDFALASDTAKFGWPEVKRGILPGLGGPGLLARAIGPRLAMELVATGRTMEAQEAFSRGLVNSLHAPADLLPAALSAASTIASNAPLSVRAAKKVLREGAFLSTKEAMAAELVEYKTLFVTEDRREGIAAFNEKRPPRFTGH
jgi:enoyl-CoA hydratase